MRNTAILSYDLDETETIFGQVEHARYHGTDTWLFRNNRWQIIAGQMLRYYEDPAAGKTDTAHLDDFVGTYELAPGVTLTVSREGSQLYSKRGDAPKTILQPESPDLFFRPGIEGRHGLGCFPDRFLGTGYLNVPRHGFTYFHRYLLSPLAN